MRRKLLAVLLWGVQGVLALEFLFVGGAKLWGMREMVELFTALGVGQWFRYVTGILELTGAVLLLVPGRGRAGAALLATVMFGAMMAHLFVLHHPPTVPGVLFLLACFVALGRGGSRPTSRE